MKINLQTSAPEELTEGVYKTTFTHPLLEGELYFMHNEKNREVTLCALENSIADDIKEILTQVKDLRGN